MSRLAPVFASRAARRLSPVALSGPMARTIVSNAGAIAITTASSALLGYPYWWLAAHQYPPAAVGFGVAVTSAMTLFGTLGVLGLGTLIVAELPHHHGRELRLIGTAVLAATLVAMVLGAAFALVGSLVSAEFGPLAEPPFLVLFAIGTGATAAGLVLDQAFIGLLRGGLQIARYVVFGGVKLALLAALVVLLPARDGLAISISWVVGAVIAIAPLGRLLSDRQHGLRALAPDWRLVRGRGRAALSHHLLNTGLQFPYLLLPIVVTTTLSATDNAYFYAAWMIANMIFLICGALTAVLYAMGVRQPEALSKHTRFTLVIGLGCGLVAALVLTLISDRLLWLLFGQAYAEQAGPVLRVLILGAFPVAIVDHYVALRRIQHRTFSAARLVILGGVLQLGLAAAGARSGGLVDLTLGWVIGLSAEAVLMLPVVYRVVVATQPAAVLARRGA